MPSRTRRGPVAATALIAPLMIAVAGCSPSATTGPQAATVPPSASLTAPDTTTPPSPAQPPSASAADWTGVGQVFGRPGVFKDGLYTLSFPRSDLAVKVGSVTLKPALSTTTSITFYGSPQQAMVMGDLVLTEDARQAVLTKLTGSGIEITAVHEHLPAHSPTVWWHHIEASGDAVQIATALKDALAAGTTPLTTPSSPAPQNTALDGLDPAVLDKIMGRVGTTAGGVHKYALPRRDTITMGSAPVPASLAQTAVAFQPVGDGRAAVNGDIVMTANEVQPVLTALRNGGLDVVELHNHMLDETPRLFYVHFWALDDATRLATALRAAIDKTNSQPGA
ncbi:protein of unknown function [Modestobacter sp. DSM 44400]|uniref:DUF1259 domain-containing protein n=1 Tax=Modestobacter sp. DSM 44400 TaxID=1550230 RepID=UPI00089AC2D3|nr:DUF1259 domain-containing protein [Modestobacter sp. DSM 44400]SDY81185.1 protein of unknown function [Modestobacter sp. DSM 44400]